MPLIVRNDEQIRVGTTPGLVAGASFFTFDGTDGKPDYRYTDIVISEISGRGVLVRDFDYSWNPTTARFQFLNDGDVLPNLQWYNVHFQPQTLSQNYDTYSLINNSFFIRDINLVNIDKGEGLEELTSFIQKYEPECLKKILRNDMYEVIRTETSARVNALIYGEAYIDLKGRNCKWQGLVHDLDQSLIANYVYFYFQQAHASTTTGVANKISKPEAGVNFTREYKMINAWNFFSEEVIDMCKFLMQRRVDGVRVYPEFTTEDVCEVLEFSYRINEFDL